ncbi:PH domain-containing protein [Actinoplanes palleronii]|uniref:Uncharacterized protein n=1 Tax=Actinoplanes palleronii TaxID=113570 RepID=A0ABQ4BDR5_9ACTN|nr:PH domain-containing protein [Actinoplanes palleronii]GIE68825.1 hypothetical protein Apa02nite_049330 [Actinoplanes palleronii]
MSSTPWHDFRPSPRARIGAYGAMVVAPLLLGLAGWSAWAGGLAAAAAFGAIGLWFAHVAGLGATLWLRPHRRSRALPAPAPIDDGSPGLTFRYSWWAYYWQGAVLVLTSAPFLLLGLAGLTSGDTAEAVFGAVLVAGALLLLAVLFRVLRHAPGRLSLTPAGVYHRGPGGGRFVPWDAVLDVRADGTGAQPTIEVRAAPSDRSRSGTRKDNRSRFTARRAERSTALTVPAAWPAAAPETVYRTLRHYLRHPADRGELSGVAAVARVRQQRLN